MNLNPDYFLKVNRSVLQDKKRLYQAIQLSKQCIPINNAFSVGAIVFDAKGTLISTGFSREEGARSHAEEVALKRAHKIGANLQSGTIYSSLEPCGKRASSNKTCTQRIIEAGISRVVIAMKEPAIFVNPATLDRFDKAGIKLIHFPEFEHEVREINKHLLTL